MSNAAVNRKYPRADVDQRGVLTVRIPDKNVTHRVPVAIRQISCEGVGLVFLDEGCPVERRDMVTMDFKVDSLHFEIPGLIAWVAPRKSRSGQLDLGIRFQLALVPNETRQAYARWIVELLRRQGAQSQPPAAR